VDSDLTSLLLDPERTKDWIETFLTVPTERGEIVPFNLTAQQDIMDKDGTGRDIRIKARQTRASSFIMARNVRRMTTSFGLNCVVITQNDQMTQLFRVRIKHHLEDLANRNMPFDILKDNEEELAIGHKMRNRFIWGSAEQKVGLRGVQTAHIIHLSETAHWPDESAKNIVGALLPACPPPPYGWFDIESTPNGAQGLFYDYTMKARPFIPMSLWSVHFYPWWNENTYTIETFRKSGLFDVDKLLSEFQPTPDEKFLMDKYGLNPGQILWRRIQTEALRRTGKFFAQEYPEDIKSCFLASGECFFADPEFDHLEYYGRMCMPSALELSALPYGDSEVSFRGARLQVWEMPVAGKSYVTWLDPSGGSVVEDSDADFAVIVVLDPQTLHHVASLCLRTTPERAAEMACAIGKWYNLAYLGIERNGPGVTSVIKARELRYPNLYYDIINEPKKPGPGWMTTEASRDRMLGGLREDVFNHKLITHDESLVMEMGAFTWEKAGRRMRPEAKRGGHDDRVMAIAGARMIAPYAPKSRPVVSKVGESADLPEPWMR